MWTNVTLTWSSAILNYCFEQVVKVPFFLRWPLHSVVKPIPLVVEVDLSLSSGKVKSKAPFLSSFIIHIINLPWLFLSIVPPKWRSSSRTRVLKPTNPRIMETVSVSLVGSPRKDLRLTRWGPRLGRLSRPSGRSFRQFVIIWIFRLITLWIFSLKVCAFSDFECIHANVVDIDSARWLELPDPCIR